MHQYCSLWYYILKAKSINDYVFRVNRCLYLKSKISYFNMRCEKLSGRHLWVRKQPGIKLSVRLSTSHLWKLSLGRQCLTFFLCVVVLVNAKSFIVLVVFCLRNTYFYTYFFLCLQNILVLEKFNRIHGETMNLPKSGISLTKRGLLYRLHDRIPIPWKGLRFMPNKPNSRKQF